MGRYTQMFQEAAASVEYWTQAAFRSFVSDLTARMERRGMNRADLAASIGASPAYITKIMRGNANFTLESMTKLAMATGGKLSVRIVDASQFASDFVVETMAAQVEPRRIAILRSESVAMLIGDSEAAANERMFGLNIRIPTTVTTYSKAA